MPNYFQACCDWSPERSGGWVQADMMKITQNTASEGASLNSDMLQIQVAGCDGMSGVPDLSSVAALEHGISKECC